MLQRKEYIGMKIPRWLICIPALLCIAPSQGQGSAAAPVTTINDGGNKIATSLAGTLEENANCSVEDPYGSINSEGDLQEPVYLCRPGQRRGSAENPCPDGETCCICSNGSYQLNYSTCDKCIQHTVCSEYDFVGDPFRDSVCKVVTAPTDLVLLGKATSVKTTTSLTTTTAEPHTITPNGPAKATPSTRVTDTGQDEKFTIHWPWSIIVFVLLLAVAVILLLLIVWAVVILSMKWHRKHIRGYNLPPDGGNNLPPDENVPLEDVAPQQQPQEQPQGNGHIPAQAAAGAIRMECADEMKAEDQS